MMKTTAATTKMTALASEPTKETKTEITITVLTATPLVVTSTSTTTMSQKHVPKKARLLQPSFYEIIKCSFVPKKRSTYPKKNLTFFLGQPMISCTATNKISHPRMFARPRSHASGRTHAVARTRSHARGCTHAFARTQSHARSHKHA